MDEDKVLRLCSRIFASEDGIELVEYLEQLSKDNYQAFLNDAQEFNEMHKGYAQSLEHLIKLFKTSSDRLARKGNNETEESKSFY